VFEDGLPAFKGEFPEAQPPPQGIPALVSLSLVSGLLVCLHIRFAFFSSWRLHLVTTSLQEIAKNRQKKRGDQVVTP
jgi:hypothetical protein